MCPSQHSIFYKILKSRPFSSQTVSIYLQLCFVARCHINLPTLCLGLAPRSVCSWRSPGQGRSIPSPCACPAGRCHVIPAPGPAADPVCDNVRYLGSRYSTYMNDAEEYYKKIYVRTHVTNHDEMLHYCSAMLISQLIMYVYLWNGRKLVHVGLRCATYVDTQLYMYQLSWCITA